MSTIPDAAPSPGVPLDVDEAKRLLEWLREGYERAGTLGSRSDLDTANLLRAIIVALDALGEDARLLDWWDGQRRTVVKPLGTFWEWSILGSESSLRQAIRAARSSSRTTETERGND